MDKAVVFKILRPNRFNYMIYANAVFLLCLLGVGFISPLTIVMAYFIESIIIGLFNALKMAMSIRYSNKIDRGGAANYSLILFFCFHYGFFIAIQSIFVFSFFEMEDNGLFREPFLLIENYSALLKLDGMWLLIVSMLITHSGVLITNFLAEKRYQEFTASELMTKPYLRIFIQQFVVILSGFFLVALHAGYVAAFLLILFRLMLDLFLLGLRENTTLVDEMAKWYADKSEQDFDKIKKQLLLFSE